MKMRFLHSLLLVTAAAFLFVSCKKEKTGGEPEETGNFITFKADGVKKSFNVDVQGGVHSEQGLNLLLMSGNQDTLSNAFFLLSINQKSGPITAGTYVDAGSNNPDLSVTAMYATSDRPEVLIKAGAGNESDPKFTVVITSITESTIKGTFSGTFYEGGDENARVQVTEGKFSIPAVPYEG